MKQGESLKAKLFEVFGQAVEDCEETTGFDQAKAVSVVKTRLMADAVEAGYDEAYASRVSSECATEYRRTNGETVNAKGAGRKAQVIPSQSYRMVVAAIDSESGRGALPGPKALAGAAKILSELKAEKISVADIRAKAKAIEPVKTAAETAAGKVIPMPQPVRKAA